ncbi:hypothetical protein P8452_38060 [Trifolium repens]|nr:hypothetical protein P8452_38060 [Trifolium repens]
MTFTPLRRLLLCSLLLLFLTNRTAHTPLHPFQIYGLNREPLRIRRVTHQCQGQIPDHANINLNEATDLLSLLCCCFGIVCGGFASAALIFSEKRLQPHLDFLPSNLRYEHSTGRESVLEMIHAIIVKFPRSVLDEKS